MQGCSRYDSDFFWIDIFCKNQWKVNSSGTALELQRCVRAAVKPNTNQPQVLVLLHPWPDPIALTRMWCLFEIMHALNADARIEMEMSRKAQGAIVSQTNLERFAAISKAVCLDNASATLPSDVDLIMADIVQMPGGKEGMEARLHQHLGECLVRFGASATGPRPQKRQRAETDIGDILTVEQRAELRGHLEWAKTLALRIKQDVGDGSMAEAEQDEGIQRAASARSIDATVARAIGRAAADADELLVETMRLYGPEELDLFEDDY
eukprot:SAG11_NODE_491_length_8977_cov_7.387249_9_plen_266_part_00